ncbi:MAG: CRTAC1 family protein [Myxococcota bacterium]
MRSLLLASVLTVACAAEALAGDARRPRFVEVSERAGIGYVQQTLVAPPDCIFTIETPGDFCEPERMSGGAAVGDVDGDGRADLYVTVVDGSDRLYRNRGRGRFEDVTEDAGVFRPELQSNGAGFADLDGDGDLDLYVTTLGDAGDETNTRNYLFVNDGSGSFREQAVERGAAVDTALPHRSFGVAFGDYDRDGWIDLHTTEWIPQFESHSRLLRNRGEEAPGTFEDRTESAGVALEGVHAFASAFSDLDRDGWPDLAVAADFGTSRLFWNRGDGSFDDGTLASGVGTDENGMGSTIGDFDGDGWLDWFVTSIWEDVPSCPDCNWGTTGNRLYRNEGNRRFSDATDAAGVRAGFWGWGAAAFDYDNDGDLDLAMTNGIAFPGTDVEEPFRQDPMRFWENDGSGRMTEVSGSIGLDHTGSGKGLLVFDYDQDGDLDLLVLTNGGRPQLYRNRGGNRRDWLRVRTRGARGNSEGLGARIEVTRRAGEAPQVREMGSVSHFLGQSERVAHFGLGRSRAGRVASVRISWPSGAEQIYRNVRRNCTLLVSEPTEHAAGKAELLRCGKAKAPWRRRGRAWRRW